MCVCLIAGDQLAALVGSSLGYHPSRLVLTFVLLWPEGRRNTTLTSLNLPENLITGTIPTAVPHRAVACSPTGLGSCYALPGTDMAHLLQTTASGTSSLGTASTHSYAALFSHSLAWIAPTSSLEGNTTLLHLNLRKNRIGATGAGRVAELLATTQQMQSIDLSSNEIVTGVETSKLAAATFVSERVVLCVFGVLLPCTLSVAMCVVAAPVPLARARSLSRAVALWAAVLLSLIHI
eukprot:1318470-Rhodomonas_salina.3